MKKMILISVLTAMGVLSAAPFYVADFKTSTQRWNTRKYWGGKVTHANGILAVKATDFKGRWWGRALGTPLGSCRGKRIKVSASVKGKGDFFAGMLIYAKTLNNNKLNYRYAKAAEAVKLTDDFQVVSYAVDISDFVPRGVTPFIEVQGKNSEAYLQWVKVEEISEGGESARKLFFSKHKKTASAKAAGKGKKVAAENSRSILSASFKKKLGVWGSRPNWSGKVSHQEQNMVIEAAPGKHGVWGRAMGVRMRRIDLPGKRFEISVYAKGTGSLQPGFLVVTTNSNGKEKYDYAKAEKGFTLTDKFKKYTFTVDFADTAPKALAPLVNVQGENSVAYIRNIRVNALSDPGAQMTLLTPMAVVPAGETAPARQFKYSKADATVQTFQGVGAQPVKMDVQPEISNETGVVTVPVKGSVNGLVKVIAAAGGASATGFVYGMEKSEYAKLDAVAAQVKADKPLNILYIGDSLNDFDRGYNSVDMLGFFLNKYNPGKFTISNYSIAGDYISRVEDRFTGKRPFDKRYDGMFDRKYDLVIIALGNNDTRSWSSSGYKTPLVPTADVKAAFERVIAHIRKHADVPVWLFSAAKGDSELMVKKSNAVTALGRVGVRFGIPALVEAFNAEIRKCAESGQNMRYIDIYTPMCAEFSSENYADGVHLSLKGHCLYAKLLLKAFVK